MAATGQGLLGNNMFAYCNNNPVINVDSSGSYPVNYYEIAQATVDLVNSVVQRLEEIEKAKQESDGISFSYTDEDEIKICNSFTVTDWQEMYAYSKYLVEESEYASFFSGSAEDVFIEWMFHNTFAYIPVFDFERARDTDVGHNIFDEDRLPLAFAMATTYLLLFPDQYQNNYFPTMSGGW